MVGFKELLQKSNEKCSNVGKEKAAKYYQANKDVLKEKARNKYKYLSEKKRSKKRVQQEKV